MSDITPGKEEKHSSRGTPQESVSFIQKGEIEIKLEIEIKSFAA